MWSAVFQSREVRSIFGFYRWSNGITRSEKVEERKAC